VVFLYEKALELWQAREDPSHSAFLPTFMVELDVVLRGGLLAGSVTEVRLLYCLSVLCNTKWCRVFLLASF